MTRARDLPVDQITEGMEARFSHQVGENAVDEFAALSGDFNPLHTDAQYAQASGHPDRVVHGALLAALASRLVGMELPGRRSLLLSLKLDFVAPTYPGDTIEVTGKIKSVHIAERVVNVRLKMTCNNELRVRGTALVRVGHCTT